MNIAGAVLSMMFALMMVVALLAGCVLATVMVVRVFRHRARIVDDVSTQAVVERLLSSSSRAAPPRAAPSRNVVARQPAVAVEADRVASPARAGPLGDSDGTVTWRYRQLLELGLDPVSAVEVAASAVDLASMRALVDKGCPAPLASRILR